MHISSRWRCIHRGWQLYIDTCVFGDRAEYLTEVIRFVGDKNSNRIVIRADKIEVFIFPLKASLSVPFSRQPIFIFIAPINALIRADGAYHPRSKFIFIVPTTSHVNFFFGVLVIPINVYVCEAITAKHNGHFKITRYGNIYKVYVVNYLFHTVSIDAVNRLLQAFLLDAANVFQFRRIYVFLLGSCCKLRLF